jgi:hypothetical protein
MKCMMDKDESMTAGYRMKLERKLDKVTRKKKKEENEGRRRKKEAVVSWNSGTLTCSCGEMGTNKRRIREVARKECRKGTGHDHLAASR